jgi:hypothetical protein
VISTPYNVCIGGFADLVGNPAATFASMFTTGPNSTPVGAGSLTVLSVSPANSTVGVSNTAKIIITFSENIDPVSANNILVRDCSLSCYSLAGTWVVSGAVATFTPVQPYPANASIDAYTQDQVVDFAGNTDNASVVTTFTIGGTLDTTAPIVTSVTPANTTTNVGPDPMVVLTFSKSLNPATVNSSTIQMLAGETPIGASTTISANNRSVMLNLGTLTPSTVYTVVATSQVQDLSGNGLVYFQSQFTTAPLVPAIGPTVVSQRPAYGATDVPPNTVITLFTSGSPLNPSTVNTNSVHVTANGLLVPGTAAVTGGTNQAIEFKPTSGSFAYGAIVSVYVDQTITDVNSVPLSAIYNTQFTIQGDPASTVPTFIGSNPLNGASGGFSNPVVQVEFDQALAPSTVNAANVTLLANNSTSTPATGTVSLIGPNNNIVQFAVSSSSPLTSGTNYYLNLDNVTNAQGVPLPNSWYTYLNPGATTNTTPPTVLSVGPPNGSTGAGVNASIILTFSSAIDPLSVNASTVQITGGSQTVVPSSMNFGRYNVLPPFFDYVSITPQAPLPPSTTMTINLSGITDPEGNAITPQTTTFKTGTGPDLTAPNVVLASAQSGDTIATNASYSYEFDRPMDPGTVNNNTFYLVDSTLGPMPGVGTVTLSSDLKTETLVLTPGTLVTGHQVYAYSTGAQDLAGNVQNAFNSAYQTVGSTADTTPPVVLETNPPASLTTGIPLNLSVQVEFSKEIAQNSVAGIQLLQGGSTLIPVTYSFSRLSTVVTLTPNVPLIASTSYTLSISGVTDTVGNVFTGTKTQTFTTGTAVKLNSPALNGPINPAGPSSVTPCCGNTAASDLPTITIVFDSAMDPLTFDTATGNAVLELTSTSAVVSTSVSFSPDFKTVMLTPSVALTSGTSYSIVVKYGVVTDMAGNTYFNSINTAFIAP